MRRCRPARLTEARLGRSRGGLTSKVHLGVERWRRPLAFALTAGQAADSPQFIPVLAKVRVRGPVGRPRTRPGAVAADKAYSSRGNREHRRTGDQQDEGLAGHRDQLRPPSYLVGLHLCASMIWIKDLTRTTP